MDIIFLIVLIVVLVGVAFFIVNPSLEGSTRSRQRPDFLVINSVARTSNSPLPPRTPARPGKKISTPVPRPPLQALPFTKEELASWEWSSFEMFCEQWLNECFQFNTRQPDRRVGSGADGGIDLFGYHFSGLKIACQCKGWKKPVGVSVVRELRGSLSDKNIKGVLFASGNGFTEDASTLAEREGIWLVGNREIFYRWKFLSQPVQDSILASIRKRDPSTPRCPNCTTRMIQRSSRSGRGDFWGCASYPRCRSRIFITESPRIGWSDIYPAFDIVPPIDDALFDWHPS